MVPGFQGNSFHHSIGLCEKNILFGVELIWWYCCLQILFKVPTSKGSSSSGMLSRNWNEHIKSNPTDNIRFKSYRASPQLRCSLTSLSSIANWDTSKPWAFTSISINALTKYPFAQPTSKTVFPFKLNFSKSSFANCSCLGCIRS